LNLKESAVSLLVIGLAIFLGIHSISIVAPGLRTRAVSSLGANGWRGLYSLISGVGFVLILYGFHLARHTPVVLYVVPAWMRHVTLLLLLPVFPLILAAYLPGRIKTAMKHPMLAAVKFWALAHLLSNGLLADVLLFGSFLIWAICDRISLKRRPQRAIATAPPGRFNDLSSVIGGLAIYLIFVLWAHAWLFGVSPLG
jgi:uncharacterized membrane protein